MQFCSYVICLLRDQWMIERLSKTMGAALVDNNIMPIPSKISFNMKKTCKWLVTAWYLQALNTFWLSNWVSIVRVVARFPQASWSLPAATAANLETPCVCAFPSDQPKQCLIAAPLPTQELGHWFCSQSLIFFWNGLGEWLPSNLQGLELGLNLDSAPVCSWRLTNGL